MDHEPRPGEPAQPSPSPGLVTGSAQAAHWGFLGFFVGLGGYHLLTLVLTAVLSGRLSGFDAAEPPALGPLLLLAFLPNVLLGLGPAVLSWWRGRGPRRDFGVLPNWRDIRVGLASGGFSLLAAWALGVVLFQVHGGSTRESTPLDSLSALADEQTVWLAAAALFLLLGAPLTEELLVRGALWGALEHYRIPRSVVLALTSLIFAFLHEESWRTLSLFAQGIAIGWARMVTGRIGASIVAHAANNLVPALDVYLSGG